MGRVAPVAGIVCLGLAIILIAGPFDVAQFEELHSFNGLAEGEVEKIRTVNEAYAAAWLKNNPPAVMGLLAKDAVLIPQGNQPIAGIEAIKKFWWPADGPRTTVKTFTITTDEIGGDRSVAYVRGTFKFTYSFEERGKTTDLTNAGNYLMIMRRQADGAWLITHRMWSDLPH